MPRQPSKAATSVPTSSPLFLGDQQRLRIVRDQRTDALLVVADGRKGAGPAPELENRPGSSALAGRMTHPAHSRRERARAAATASFTAPGPGAGRCADAVGGGRGRREATVAHRAGDLAVGVAEGRALGDQLLGGVGGEELGIGGRLGHPLALELDVRAPAR